MIDVHTHILPNIDDGSKSVEESIALLNMENLQGVKKIIATPHFYSHRHSLDFFLERRNHSYEKLKNALKDIEKNEEENMTYPSILLGAEVYFFEGISKASILPKLCVEGTDILLLEMPFCQWDETIYKEVESLACRQGLTVILAHVDRYIKYQKKKKYLWEILSLPVIVQLNGESFLSFFERKFPIQYLKEGHTVLFGSDCHNMENRMPNLEQARNYIRKKVGAECLEKSDALALELFGSYS